jgi:hypothetical protein
MSLVLGVVLALAALAFVLYPIFRAPSDWIVTNSPQGSDGNTGVSEKQSAIDALREIEFDRATGKLSDSDYATLRARYTSAAVTEMRNSEADAAAAASGGADPASSLDEAEALISRFRTVPPSCSACGPRPEPDAVYCSNCGLFLAAACNHCGARVIEPGARFCSSCGAQLAA